MLRNILATITGIIVAMTIITLIQKLGYVIFPLPENANIQDPVWIKNNLDLIPIGAMITVIIAHGLGVISGMGIAGMISKKSIIPAYITGITMIVITLIMFFIIPSPIWFYITDSSCVIAGFFFGKSLAQKNVYN